MKFTLETEPFKRMLQMLAQTRRDRRARCAPLQLDASRGRLRVQKAGLAAEIDAVVWRDGRCAVSAARLMTVLERCEEPVLVAEVEDERLRLGDFFVPCVTNSEPILSQASSRIFFASDLGVVTSASAGVLTAVA